MLARDKCRARAYMDGGDFVEIAYSQRAPVHGIVAAYMQCMHVERPIIIIVTGALDVESINPILMCAYN